MKGYKINIEAKTLANENYREVLFTAPHMQLVVMTLQGGEEIGEEVHAEHDQFIRVEQGKGKVVMDGEEHDVRDGDAVIIPAGTRHNVINASPDQTLKLYTIYTPPEHKPGTIHPRKQDSK